MLLLRSRSLKRLLSLGSGRRSDHEPSKTSPDDVIPPADVVPLPKLAWRCYSYHEISQATANFCQDNLVGRGGHAEVYKGVLTDGRAIAVKRLSPALTDTNGKREKEFLSELGTVGHVNHPNVSRLLGCCVENGLHFIFELSSRGSVSSNLHDESKPVMTWKQRFNIAVGTARGLQYLHKGCQRRIIHRDIKASNVLLTDNFEPQISDFGLARWLPAEWSYHAIAPIEGTFGCLAPEYYTHGIVDEKTDVFAFGIFLLEVISGRKPVDRSHKSLLSWAKPYFNDESIEDMMDPRIGDDYDLDQLRRLTFVASLCVRASASWRPTMTETNIIEQVMGIRVSMGLQLEELLSSIGVYGFHGHRDEIYTNPKDIYLQVLELLEGTRDISSNLWQMSEAEQEEENYWDFDDLDEGSISPSSSFSSTRSTEKYLLH